MATARQPPTHTTPTTGLSDADGPDNPQLPLYRKQVIKQADLVLAMQFRPDAFTDKQKARNFAYYETLTVRDSSLSACVQAVIAAEVGHLNLADDYLAEAALMDLDDLEHNTRDGLHVASLAGVWTGLVASYGGMRHNDGSLSFSPRLPPGLTRLTFGLLLAGRTLRVEITHTAASYSLLDGKTLNILSPSAGHGVRRGTADLLHPSPAANRDQTDSTPRARPHTPPS